MKSLDLEVHINQHYKYNKDLNNVKNIIIPIHDHCNQNRQTINKNDENSNKNSIKNNENINKKKYDMKALNPIESNTNTNNQNSQTVDGSDENSNKNSVENNENINKKKYYMKALNPIWNQIQLNANMKDDISGIKIIIRHWMKEKVIITKKVMKVF
eukprot:57227_1